MKGLILAGGLGTRLRPLSHTGPKQLVRIGNKPVIFYGIEDMVATGIKEIGIIVGYTSERINQMISTIGHGERWGIKITYIEQDAPRGLAHAVGIAEDFINGEDFIVYCGDNILEEGVKKIVEDFKGSGMEHILLLCRVKNAHPFGVAIVDSKGHVLRVEEKPKKPISNLAIVGIYLFKKSIFDCIKRISKGRNNELQLTDAIKLLIKEKKGKVSYHIVYGWWDDTGTAESVLHANQMVLSKIKPKIRGQVDSSCQIIGQVNIGEGTIVKKNCFLRGPLIIGNNCKIGPNSYIGPYTSIGDNVTLIEGEIESSIVLAESNINFQEKIVDSLIGQNCKIISDKKLPKGHKLILGEHSEVRL